MRKKTEHLLFYFKYNFVETEMIKIWIFLNMKNIRILVAN